MAKARTFTFIPSDNRPVMTVETHATTQTGVLRALGIPRPSDHYVNGYCEVWDTANNSMIGMIDPH